MLMKRRTKRALLAEGWMRLMSGTSGMGSDGGCRSRFERACRVVANRYVSEANLLCVPLLDVLNIVL